MDPAIQKERVIEVSARVARLRRELRDADAELDLLLGHTPPGAQADEGRARASDEPLPARILRHAMTSPDKVFSADDFAEVLEGSTMETLRSTLLRMAKKGQLESTARGRFRLAAEKMADA